MSQKVCPQCQMVNDTSAQFCGGCGSRMTPAEPQAPAYQAPQVPQYQAPQYQAPQAPQYQAPQAPQYQAPQAPQYPPQVPQYQAPQQPPYQPAQPGQQPFQYQAPGAMPQAPYMGATQQAVYQSFGAPAGMLMPAGFGIRFLAFLIDMVILAIPGYFLTGVVLYVIQAGYYIGMWGARGQTVGEMVLGLRVVSADGQPISFGKAAMRFVGYAVSGLILGIGFLMIAFDSQQHRGLHDRIAGTLMVKKA
ncbi:MAG TPA: RDD family protein [Symbiobacteriaceae bacterium]|nr:RDD family protein [Symbiobacteriaceae bacterium]